MQPAQCALPQPHRSSRTSRNDPASVPAAASVARLVFNPANDVTITSEPAWYHPDLRRMIAYRESYVEHVHYIMPPDAPVGNRAIDWFHSGAVFRVATVLYLSEPPMRSMCPTAVALIARFHTH